MRALDLLRLPGTPLTDAQAPRYQAAGFEIALHRLATRAPRTATTSTSRDGRLRPRDQRRGVRRHVAEPRGAGHRAAPTASCGATGPTEPKAEREHGIRLDTNYYYWPGAWVQNRPGMFTGSGFPMRFADTRRLADRRLPGGDPAHRRVGHRRRRRTSRRCSTARSGPRATTASSPPTCTPTRPTTRAPTRSSPRPQARGVPVVSAAQMLDLARRPQRLVVPGTRASAAGSCASRSRPPLARAACRRWCPPSSADGALTGLTRDGAAGATSTRRTVKGIDYAMFDAAAGDYVATYPPRRVPQLMLAADDPSRSLLPAHRARGPGRRRGALAQARRARRALPPGRLGPVELAARRLARARERRADRARGDRPHRRPGDAHAADHPGGALEAQRALRLSRRSSSSRIAAAPTWSSR